MWGRAKKQRPDQPAPVQLTAAQSELRRSLIDEGALITGGIDDSEPLVHELRLGAADGPRPVTIEVDGEYGWEGGATTPEKHLGELLSSAQAVMERFSVPLSWGDLHAEDDEQITGQIGGERLTLATAGQPGRPVLNASMACLDAANTVAARAGSPRRWFFLPLDDRMGPAFFLTPEQAAALAAEPGAGPGQGPDADEEWELGAPGTFIGS